MSGDGSRYERCGGPGTVGGKDAMLFQTLSEANLLEQMPAGAKRALPVLAFVLEHLVAEWAESLKTPKGTSPLDGYGTQDSWLPRGHP